MNFRPDSICWIDPVFEMTSKEEIEEHIQALNKRKVQLESILHTERFNADKDWTDSTYCMDAFSELCSINDERLPNAQKALAEFDKEKLEAANNRKEQLELLLDKAYYNAPIDGDPNWERCTELFAELYTLEHETIPKLTKRIQDKEQDDE